MLRATLIAAAYLFISASAAAATEESIQSWLRGSDNELELCLHGEVLDEDGRPATGLQVVGKLNATLADHPLTPTIDGNRFKIWIPVNRVDWFSLWLRASSADSNRVAYAQLNRYQLRQAAINGLKLSLESPTRDVIVKVIQAGKPVSGATVKAEVGFGIELRSTTGENGVARLALLPRQEVSSLTAWTEDHRIGGYQFDRKPSRDPELDEHIVELSKCRDQKVRFVAEDGSPVPNLRFALQIATPPPDYNYIGFTDHAETTTDGAGEAVWPWFPDWKDVHSYPEIDDNKWVLEGDPKFVDGVMQIKVKPRLPRQRITGRVLAEGTSTVPGGFFVHLRSFQGERESHSDVTSTFSNADGTFSVTVLPDATYCAYVQDEKWVGKTIDVIPYKAATYELTPVELTIAEGQPVEVVVTSGPKKRPVPNLTVSFSRNHNYTWIENGETQYGTGGPQSWATTDDSGIAIIRTLPGNLDVSIYTPRWRAEESIEVVAGKPARIELHRAIDEKRTVMGRLVFDGQGGGELESVDIHVGSLDTNYEDERVIKSKSHGLFSFDTFASNVGIFACTPDGKAAGSLITKDLDWRIKLTLLPTIDYHGQLLGPDDKPLADHRVYAYIRLEGDQIKAAQPSPPATFDVKRLEAKTDSAGNFTLNNLPTRTKVLLIADAVDGYDGTQFFRTISLEPGKSPPRNVFRLSSD